MLGKPKICLLLQDPPTSFSPILGVRHPLLLPLLDRSSLWYLLSDFRKQGIDTVYIFCPESMQAQINDLKWQWTSLMMHIEWLNFEQSDRLHDLHADEDPIFFMQNPCFEANLLRDMLMAHQQSQADCTLQIKPQVGSKLYLAKNNNRLSTEPEVDEMQAVSPCGTFLFESDIFETLLEQSENFFADFYDELVDAAEYIYGFQSKQTAFAFLNLQHYLDRQIQVLESRQLLPAGSYRPHAPSGHLWVGEDCIYPPETEFCGPVVLNHRVRIARGVKIQGPCILGSDLVIEKNCQITQALLWEQSHIESDSCIEHSWLGKAVRIKAQSHISHNFIGSFSQIATKQSLKAGSILGQYSQICSELQQP